MSLSSLPQSEPRQLTAGETALWQRNLLPDFPAGTWTLTYYLLGASRITIAAAQNGSFHEINVPAATTANYAPGTYVVHARISDGTTTLAVKPAFPTLQVLLNPAVADVPPLDDPRSFAVRTLEQVEKAIFSLAGKTVSQTTVNGTTYTLHDLDKLNKLRAQLLAEVKSEEEAANPGQSPRLILQRFSRPS